MKNNTSRYNFIDQAIMQFDQLLGTLFSSSIVSQNPYPGENKTKPSLTASEQKNVAGLMRINHTGEVCAQALYQGQALTAQLTQVREQMAQAAQEEADHLAWCQQRLNELSSHTSYFNAFWYLGSFCIGAFAGLAGDHWSLGFVAETERQVVAHLQQHIQSLPQQDERSRAILEQMISDEGQHATTAFNAGGAPLPNFIRTMMHYTADIMKAVAYRI